MSLAEVLDAPGLSERFLPLSVEAYHLLGEAGLIPEKTELIEGCVIKKVSKTPLHRYLVQRLIKLLRAATATAPVWLQSEQPISFGSSEPEPDIAVIRGREEDYFDRHPPTAEFVIEIAVNSHAVDRRKARIYAGMGVKEYWIVLVPERAIEIYHQPVNGAYQEMSTVHAGAAAVSTSLPSFQVKVDELFKK